LLYYQFYHTSLKQQSFIKIYTPFELLLPLATLTLSLLYTKTLSTLLHLYIYINSILFEICCQFRSIICSCNSNSTFS
jgi:hypothetical protein